MNKALKDKIEYYRKLRQDPFALSLTDFEEMIVKLFTEGGRKKIQENISITINTSKAGLELFEQAFKAEFNNK